MSGKISTKRPPRKTSIRANADTKTEHQVRRVRLDSIHATPENDQLYRPVDPNDPDVGALAQSILAHGVREPLVITEDGYILSGHRRWTGARLAGLTHVPCRTEAIRYQDCDPDTILRLLREHNRQRVKTLDEMLREEVVSLDPTVAYAQLIEHRKQKSDMSGISPLEIELSDRRQRNGISDRKQEMLQAALEAIKDRRDFWPLSVRQVHYVLLNNPPLRNTGRKNSRYANDRASYGDLCDLLTRARLTGEVPWQAIGDETRPTTQWDCHANVQLFVRQQLDGLFRSYARDLQRSQPNHVEIVAEKLTVQSIVVRIASRYCLPVTIGRGYCSITPRRDMAMRYLRSGKEKLVVLLLSDLDPDGENIVESFGRSMRDDFGIEDLVPIKVALTPEQVQSLGLRPQMEAKKGSRQYAKFTREHGKNVYELEAVKPEVLQQLLSDAIDSVMDIDALNHEIDAEREDAAFLEEARQRARLALAGVGDGV